MIARLIGWSARNLVLVLTGTIFAVAAGVLALRTLPLDAIPDLSDVQAIVYTEYPGRPRRWSRTKSPIRSPPPC